MRQLSENMMKKITKEATIEIKCYNLLELGAIRFFQIYFQSTDSESDVMSWVISPYSFNCNAFHTTDYSQCQIGKQNWLLHVFLILLLILNQIQRRSWVFLSCFYQFAWLLFKISSFFLESLESLSDSYTNVNDHVYEHSCAVTWHGLKLMAERDAERENDGDAIISRWRLDMIPFWNNNHNKYLILGHILLSGILNG